jgi:hypothetical protein
MTDVRERKARNHLKKLGYTLEKTPPRHWTRAKRGVGYMITQGSQVVGGEEFDVEGFGTISDYMMTLADVETFIAERAAHEVDQELRAVLRSYTDFGGDRFVEVAAAMVREVA